MTKKKYRFIPDLDAAQLAERQLDGLCWTLKHVYENSSFYRERLSKAGFAPGDVKCLDDLQKLPFTTVEDLREGYPLPLLSVPESEVIRIHASSGTTGKRKILAYTEDDVETWRDMFARCYELAGLTTHDRVQIAVGYGLWTAGVGFQLGCERFGAMAVPVGPGNMEMHLQLLTDLKTTCLCSTASMALLMSEEVAKRDLRKKIHLQRLIFGAETHTPRMRKRFEEMLGLKDSFDITGMTELYGPGTGLECSAHNGVHYWADLFILEILDPLTLVPVEPGQVGEMVVTSLQKQASPLVRYRTRDLTRLLPGDCPCGVKFPRHDRLLGRSDDMFTFRGVNVYPGQVAAVLEKFKGIGSEYLIHLYRRSGKDQMVVKVERKPGEDASYDQNLSGAISEELRKHILARGWVEIVEPGELPRSLGKTKRVQDERDGESED